MFDSLFWRELHGLSVYAQVLPALGVHQYRSKGPRQSVLARSEPKPKLSKQTVTPTHVTYTDILLRQHHPDELSKFCRSKVAAWTDNEM